MTAPGSTAEASLYQTREHYRTPRHRLDGAGGVPIGEVAWLTRCIRDCQEGSYDPDLPEGLQYPTPSGCRAWCLENGRPETPHFTCQRPGVKTCAWPAPGSADIPVQCCPTTHECCPSGSGHLSSLTCCPPGKSCCGGTCCPTGQVCCDGTCCGPGQGCCDGECFTPGQQVCTSAGVCLPKHVCAGGCCFPDQDCVAGKCCGGPICHGTRRCCPGEQCTPTGCCPNERVTASKTCCAGVVCKGTDADAGTEKCCRPDQTCASGDCCDEGVCCEDGVPCRDGKQCTKGICCPPGQRAVKDPQSGKYHCP